MATLALLRLPTCIFNPQPNLSSYLSPSTDRRFVSLSSKSTSQGFNFPEKIAPFPSKSARLSQANPTRLFSNPSPASASSHTFDVVVIGAGIIGLSIARQLLLESDLSVAVVEAKEPCFGATGAGQGSIWMVHKTPGSETWELSKRSNELWNSLADSIQHQGRNPSEELGWKKSGSMLVGRSFNESVMLKKRVNQLRDVGLRAEFLSSSDLQIEEPALMVGDEGGAAFLPDDSQLDARRTVEYILKSNRKFMSNGRYAEFFNNPATCLRSSSGEIEAVQTSHNTLYSTKAIVVATGCWTGSVMNDLIRGSGVALNIPVKPRKGHLLVLENFSSLKINHGLAELGYTYHADRPMLASTTASGDDDEALSVSMTASIDSSGNLLLGSSRQFVGFNTEVNEFIINLIWEQAGQFFPSLRGITLTDLITSKKARVGLRPYMPDCKPVIGPVPGLPKVFLAAGHEGEGLSMALGTAEIVTDMVLGNPSKVDWSPFSVRS